MTTFGGSTIPPIFSGSDSASGGGGGGGSFTTAPINFVDQTLNYVLPPPINGAFQRSISIQFSDFNANLNQNSDGNISPPNQFVPIQPQWNVNTPIAGQGSSFQVAWITDVAGLPLSQFAFDNPPIAGKFITINAFPGAQSADLRFFVPVAGIYFNESTYQIRENFGAFTVLAQANVVLECLATP